MYVTFNENLHEHISHELAGDAGRESDTAWAVKRRLCVSPWPIHLVSRADPRNDSGTTGGKQVTKNENEFLPPCLLKSKQGFLFSLRRATV